jgi:hypothetical protein
VEKKKEKKGTKRRKNWNRLKESEKGRHQGKTDASLTEKNG